MTCPLPIQLTSSRSRSLEVSNVPSHVLPRLTSKIWVIKLDVSHSSCIQDIQFRADSLRDICQVLLIASVHFRRKSQSILVPQMVPRRSNHSQLDFSPPFFWNQGLQVLKLGNQGALPLMANLPSADARLPGLVSLLNEACNIWNIRTEEVHRRVPDLGHALQFLKESTPEDSPPGQACQKMAG